MHSLLSPQDLFKLHQLAKDDVSLKQALEHIETLSSKRVDALDEDELEMRKKLKVLHSDLMSGKYTFEEWKKKNKQSTARTEFMDSQKAF